MKEKEEKWLCCGGWAERLLAEDEAKAEAKRKARKNKEKKTEHSEENG